MKKVSLLLVVCFCLLTGTCFADEWITGKVYSVGPTANGIIITVTGTVGITGEIIADPRPFKANTTDNKENQLLATALCAQMLGSTVRISVTDASTPNSILKAIYVYPPVLE